MGEAAMMAMMADMPLRGLTMFGGGNPEIEAQLQHLIDGLKA